MEQNIISVVLPCYNVEDYIRQGLDSVLKQTYNNWEAILVDDGSTDKTGEICDEYALKDLRIKVIHTKNQGVSAARNTGIRIAKGDILYFMDPDDEIKTNCFERCIETFTLYNPDVVHFNRRRIKNGKLKDDDLIKQETVDGKNILTEYSAGLIGLSQNALYHYYKGDKIFHYKKNWQVWSFMFRRLLIIENGIHFHEELRMFEDAIFLVEATMKAVKIVRIPDVLYTYYIRSNGALNRRVNDTNKIFNDKYRLIKRRAEIRKQIKDFDMHDFYIGSQVMSSLQLCIALSVRLSNYKLCNKYICSPEVAESIDKVDIKGAPLKFRIPVILLKNRMQSVIFYLCFVIRKIGLSNLLKY